MAATTSRYGFPYQEANDPPAGHTLGQQLAQNIETDLGAVDDRLVAVEADLNTAETAITTLQGATTGKPLCILRKVAVTSVANGGATLVWDTEDLDTHNMHSTSSNTSRVTPNKAGWYRLSATVHFATNGTGRRGVRFTKNGSGGVYSMIIPGSTAGNVGVHGSIIMQANGTTDYFEVFAYQDSGAALNTADPTGTLFEVEFLR